MVSLEGLRRHKESVVGGMVAAHEKLFADSGMDFVLGTARFVAHRTVEIATRSGAARLLRARDVVINTGTMPETPDLPGIEAAGVWDSESILQLHRIPASLLVLGGGYVGCEFRLDVRALRFEGHPPAGPAQVLPREDPDVAEEVTDVLTAQGVDVRVGARATGVHREPGHGDVVVSLQDGSEVRGANLLVATGRAAVSAELDLAAAGVEVSDRGFIAVDDHLRTTAEHVWAAGDVAGSPQFTHASWHDFRVLNANLTGGDAVTTGRLVPYTVFITPELARVGLTERDARATGRRVRAARLPVAAIPRAKTLHDTVGTWKAVVDADSHQILGAALLGHDSGEVIAALQMAMIGGLRYEQVRDAVLTHPTMAEGLNLLFDALAEAPPERGAEAAPDNVPSG